MLGKKKKKDIERLWGKGHVTEVKQLERAQGQEAIHQWLV